MASKSNEPDCASIEDPLENDFVRAAGSALGELWKGASRFLKVPLWNARVLQRCVAVASDEWKHSILKQISNSELITNSPLDANNIQEPSW
jgi:hypothetical protein